MKKITLLLLILLGNSRVSQGQKTAEPLQVSSKIEKVTVFLKGAQVFRNGKISLPPGRSQVIFKGISPNLDKQSIQVKGDGAFTILSVNHQLNLLEEQTRRDDITKIESEKYRINEMKKRKSAQLGIYRREESLLEKNQIVSGQQNGIVAAELVQVADFQRKRWNELTMQEMDLTSEIAKLDSSMLKLEKQLQALNQKKELSTSEIVVTVAAKSATEAKFEMTYYVLDAGWFANYDLRVKDISHPIDLAFKANVRQNTGEDWKEVNLVISSGDPTANSVSQELSPWRLRFGSNAYPYSANYAAVVGNGSGGITEVRGKVIDNTDGSALIGATVQVKGTSIGTVTDIDGSYSIKVPANPSTLVFSYTGFSTKEIPVNNRIINAGMEAGALLEEVVVVGYGIQKKLLPSIRIPKRISEEKTIPMENIEVYQPTTVNFVIELPYTILSDGKNYVVEIKTEQIPTEYKYFAAPKIDENAYLTANISEWQELNLMDGEVNLFFEGAFLGRSLLSTSSASDTLEISLGPDKSIVVKRTKLKEKSIRQAIGPNRIERRGFEISVKNNKQQPINLTVQDQFPISTNKEIEVNDQKFEEGGDLDKDTQILTWKLDLAPKAERKLGLQYSVKYPKRQVLLLE